MDLKELGFFLFMEEQERIEKEKQEAKAKENYSENKRYSWWESEPQQTGKDKKIK